MALAGSPSWKPGPAAALLEWRAPPSYLRRLGAREPPPRERQRPAIGASSFPGFLHRSFGRICPQVPPNPRASALVVGQRRPPAGRAVHPTGRVGRQQFEGTGSNVAIRALPVARALLDEPDILAAA